MTKEIMKGSRNNTWNFEVIINPLTYMINHQGRYGK
jgi:hypothetical protein